MHFFFFQHFWKVAFVCTNISRFWFVCYNKTLQCSDLFLKFKTNINELGFDSFLLMYHNRGSYAEKADAKIYKRKPQIIELKKNFYKTVRANRLLIADLFNKKTRRSRSMSRFVGVVRSRQGTLFLSGDILLLLLKAHFCVSVSDAQYMIAHGHVSVNGVRFRKCQRFCDFNKETFINIVYHKNLFLLYSFFLNKVTQLKSKLILKQQQIQASKINLYKQRTTHFSRKFKMYVFFYAGIPTHLEVDFFTLSFFVLKLLCKKQEDLRYISIKATRSYNWTITS